MFCSLFGYNKENFRETLDRLVKEGKLVLEDLGEPEGVEAMMG